MVLIPSSEKFADEFNSVALV